MTTGSFSRTIAVLPAMRSYIHEYQQIGKTLYDLGETTIKAAQTYEQTSTKNWNGGDMTKTSKGAPRKPRGIKRYYYVPVKSSFVNRKGIVIDKVKLVKRGFYQRVPDPTGLAPLRNRKLEPHSYSMTWDKLRMSPFSYKREQKVSASITNIQWIFNENPKLNGLPAYLSPPTFDANDQIKLVNKLKTQLRGSDFNLAVFLGESHQTVSMIADCALRVAKAITLTRKGNIIAAAKTLTDGRYRTPKKHENISRPKPSMLANNWLELQYGWLPLFSDMEEGAKQLAHRVAGPFVKTYTVKIRKVVYHNSSTRSQVGVLAWGDAKYSITRKLTAYMTEPESTLTVSGLLDPELVAWELLPFSFVADWVIPIGSYLEARAFSRRLVGTFVTTDFKRDSCYGVIGFYNPDPAVYTYSILSPSNANRDWVSMTRTVSSTLDVPLPKVKELGKIASWRHAANAVALLTQVVVSPKKTDAARIQKATNALYRDLPRERRSSEYLANLSLAK